LELKYKTRIPLALGKEVTLIEYRIGGPLNLDDVIDVYEASTLGLRRPTTRRERMRAMIKHANLIVTAWDDAVILGIARSFTDFAYVTYMADLAVRVSHQRTGIGKELIRRTQEAAGPDTTLVLVSAPAAELYYPHIGFIPAPHCWILPAKDKFEHYRVARITARTNWKIK
jgi:GNAT superfamily N-acetyltransferase